MEEIKDDFYGKVIELAEEIKRKKAEEKENGRNR